MYFLYLERREEEYGEDLEGNCQPLHREGYFLLN